MAQNCFLCTGEIRNNSTGVEENFILLCQILDIPHLGQEGKECHHGIDFCHRCSYRILSIREMLEDLEKLEKKVLKEKYLIEAQLKDNSRKINDETVCPSPSTDSKSMNQLRGKIVGELTAGSIQSMLKKIRKGEVGRKPYPRKSVPIMKDVQIQNIPTPGNGTIGMYSVQSIETQSQVPDSATRSDVFVNLESLIDYRESLPLEFHLHSQSKNSEILEDPGKTSLSPETWTTSEVEQCGGGIEIKYETNSYMLDVDNDPEPLDVVVVPTSESTVRNDLHYTIAAAGMSTEIASNSVKFELGVGEQFGVTNFTNVQGSGITKSIIGGTNNNPRTSGDRKHRRSVKLPPHMRPKKCEECGRMLSSRNNWRNHILQVHRKQHKFKCTSCDFGCRTKCQIESHQQIHSDVRSFRCDLCQKTFKQKKCLSQHLKWHCRQQTTDSDSEESTNV